MILTVTLNAALDVTYEVPELVPRTSHRVAATYERAGGKGVNVARVLGALGLPTAVTGLVGGPTGRLVREDLHLSGLRDALVPVAGDTRRTVTVVARADGDATVFNQSGPEVSPAEWKGFLAHFAELAARATVVVLAGSLPPGLPEDAYGLLVEAASAAGAATVLDTSGTALMAALPAGPDVVKPNAVELAEVTAGLELPEAAEVLRGHGARTVVASAGPNGLYALTRAAAWRARPPQVLEGNPTGAGDACVAALAAGLAAGHAGHRLVWPEVLREAVALSAAAVARPVAGEFDPEIRRRFADSTTVEEIHAGHTH